MDGRRLCVLYWAVWRDDMVGYEVGRDVSGFDEFGECVMLCRLSSKAMCDVGTTIKVII
jgi:hypothetical protein